MTPAVFLDTVRILALLEREKLPASFYVPAVSAILAPEMVPAIQKSGRHEIALHGWIHESLPVLNDGPEEEPGECRLRLHVLTSVFPENGSDDSGNESSPIERGDLGGRRWGGSR